MYIKIIILFSALFFIACSSKSTVVLANSGEEQNSVIINTHKGSAKLDKVGEFVKLKSPNETPSDIKIMSDKEMQKRFNETLLALPKKAETFIIYFQNNGNEFSQGSEEKFQKALQSVQARMPCMIDVIGHTDTVGSNEINQQMSLERAKKITERLISNGIDSKLITSKGYGEEDLLIPTPDNTPEPKNRSVEIFIK
ncbi:OmpA family protein [bacterium]|nr:OmpA family protein [bacterium]MBU1959453.1 OmpA family protein [bacterium]